MTSGYHSRLPSNSMIYIVLDFHGNSPLWTIIQAVSPSGTISHSRQVLLFSITLIWVPKASHISLLRHLIVVIRSLSCVQLFATPWAAAHQTSQPFSISIAHTHGHGVSDAISSSAAPSPLPPSFGCPQNYLYISDHCPTGGDFSGSKGYTFPLAYLLSHLPMCPSWQHLRLRFEPWELPGS